MQLHCLEKNGKQFTKMVSYCAYHRYCYCFIFFSFLDDGYYCYWFHIIALSTVMYRAPNPDTVLIVETPKGTFSTKSLLQNKRHMGARLISTSRLKLEEPSPEDTEEVDPFSAARCRIYKRTQKVCPKKIFLCYAYKQKRGVTRSYKNNYIRFCILF